MAGRRKGAFTFDLSHPIKKGVLLKQGAFHKAFKYRFFLVYPGFLVYYDQENRWRLDLTKGDTLGGRLGAIKLKGGSCNIAKDAPKACKFGFIVHAPDPLNKRPTFLINATSKQDRDEWIQAIRKSTPQSPQQQRKNDGSPRRIKEEPKQKEPEPHPSSPVRQDTAAVAATVATENERLNGVDQSITSIDEDLQPTLDVRRDTAASAALSLTSRNQRKEENSSATENHQDTSIDDILGPRIDEDKESDVSDQSSQRTTSPTDSSSIPAHSPDPEVTSVNNEVGKTAAETEVVKEAEEVESENKVDSSPMELSETVENQMNSHGNVEVVTSVTVECTGNGEATVETACDGNGSTINEEDSMTKGDLESNHEGERQQEVASDDRKVKNDESALLGQEKKEDSLESSSSEVLITHEERSNSFSVNVTNIDTDDYSSSEEDETQPPPFVESSQANGTSQTPEVTLSEEAPTVNGECPTITVEAVEGEKESGEGDEKKDKRSGSESSGTEGDKLNPTPEGRRSSQPFIEKKGFIYKMGGKRKNWNLRYFVLRPGVFTYSKNPNSKLLGEVKLKNLQVFFPGVGERKTSFQFTIHTESTWNKRMDWVLAAQSEREMKDWILAFRLAGQKNMPSPATSDNEHDSS